jgi:mannose-6-phosphate isomerase-like protein (cupin superfamily)
VLEGEYEFCVGEQTVRAGPGTFVFGPRGIPHTFKCVGTSPGKIQGIISPPGFEAFFKELDVLAKQGPPDTGQVVALAGKYGLKRRYLFLTYLAEGMNCLTVRHALR